MAEEKSGVNWIAYYHIADSLGGGQGLVEPKFIFYPEKSLECRNRSKYILHISFFSGQNGSANTVVKSIKSR